MITTQATNQILTDLSSQSLYLRNYNKNIKLSSNVFPPFFLTIMQFLLICVIYLKLAIKQFCCIEKSSLCSIHY